MNDVSSKHGFVWTANGQQLLFEVCSAIKIGSSSECQLAVEEAEPVHAEVIVKDSQVKLKCFHDTQVQGQVVKHDTEIELKRGFLITIGSVVLKYTNNLFENTTSYNRNFTKVREASLAGAESSQSLDITTVAFQLKKVMMHTNIYATKTDLTTFYARVFGISEAKHTTMHKLFELVCRSLDLGPYTATRDELSTETYYRFSKDKELKVKQEQTEFNRNERHQPQRQQKLVIHIKVKEEKKEKRERDTNDDVATREKEPKILIKVEKGEEDENFAKRKKAT